MLVQALVSQAAAVQQTGRDKVKKRPVPVVLHEVVIKLVPEALKQIMVVEAEPRSSAVCATENQLGASL